MADESEFFAAYRDPRWQEKRLRIMERDGFMCCRCDTKEKPLNVHHGYYRRGAKPWEYEDETLTTLCEDCHAATQDRMRDLKRLTGLLGSSGLMQITGYVTGVVIMRYGPRGTFDDLVAHATHVLKDVPPCPDSGDIFALGYGLAAAWQLDATRLLDADRAARGDQPGTLLGLAIAGMRLLDSGSRSTP